ncbi:MAG: hybrid sensor histidine kinase/response regulator [Paucimonas sp.]|nr:hybrid sensor histidine kinase/response regulator [Paucimonas sp.]
MSSPNPSVMASLVEAERFRLFVQGVTDYAIYMLSPEGVIDSWNAGAKRFKGYAAEEIIGRHFSIFYTPEDLSTSLPERALKTAAETGKFEGEGWRVRKDGSRFWAHVVIDAIRDEGGVLVGFAKITRDITERKQATQALHASEERFRLLVQGVVDYAIYMLSPSGEITNWNAGAKRIKGYDHDEVVGTNFSRFYTDEDRAANRPAIALATAERAGRFENEGWRVRKDGSRFWAHVVIDPIRNELGELVGFAKVTRDVTERRKASAELERAKEALFQSQKLEAIGKLTGGVAHDFNNLLNVIINGLDMLAGEVKSPASAKILESMQRAASRGSTLTQQLLTFARQQPLRQEKHNLNAVIGSFEAVLRRANKGSVSFDIRQTPTLSAVMVDPAQFEAALLNLVVNARDATEDGGRIVLTTENVVLAEREVNSLPAGAYVRVAVEDNGAGMTPVVAARAIEPFFTTKEVGKGTGMGLSQVYGFVQQSGGDLSIQSRSGRGTTVAMYLPAMKEEALDSDQPGSDAVTEKALVVDDQPEVLELTIELFRSLGFEVLSAGNGRDALDMLQRHPDIDVLFSDVVMPGMSGIALGQQARVLRPKLKVILASGYAAPALAEHKEGLKEFLFLTKPYRVNDIIRMLRVPG